MATKKTVTKKTAVKKAAASKQPTAQENAPATTKVAKKRTKSTGTVLTTVVAKVDVGWGNHLYIRGEGAGLSWNSGILMDWSEDGWIWTTSKATGPIQFKVLINDERWSEGDNVTVESGGTCIISPIF